jgi:hypothetical protein
MDDWQPARGIIEPVNISPARVTKVNSLATSTQEQLIAAVKPKKKPMKLDFSKNIMFRKVRQHTWTCFDDNDTCPIDRPPVINNPS